MKLNSINLLCLFKLCFFLAFWDCSLQSNPESTTLLSDTEEVKILRYEQAIATAQAEISHYHWRWNRGVRGGMVPPVYLGNWGGGHFMQLCDTICNSFPFK